MKNAGYEIIMIEYYTEDYAIVLGVNKHNNYVTWDSKPSENNFFWGHYFQDKTNALRDYHTRLLTFYNERCSVQ